MQELTGCDLPFWIAAGGKFDYTIKWWDPQRYQQVVDHFRGRIQFVQVGEEGHHHPRFDGVIDLRGRTDQRQLIRLVYHAQGVLCGVTSLMHFAAAVPVRWAAAPRRTRRILVPPGHRFPAALHGHDHNRRSHPARGPEPAEPGLRSRTQPPHHPSGPGSGHPKNPAASGTFS